MSVSTKMFSNKNYLNLPNKNIWFQQDGAPPHFVLPVRHFLNNHFPER